MVPDRLARLSGTLVEEGLDHASLSSFVSLRYFTEYQATVEIEPSLMTPLLGVLYLLGPMQTAC